MMILTFDCGFAPYLKALGHETIDVRGQEHIFSLPEFLERERLQPDFIIQQERLGPRLLIQNVESAPCPTAFLAIDSHLNMFWQRSYARLFDILLTPHLSLFTDLPPAWRHPNALRFSHLGTERAWKPHVERRYNLAVCARMTVHRQIRTWLFTLLQERHGLELREELSFSTMLDLYADTCLIPNESIGFEVNFRLFEGASCGALVFTPAVGEDQDSVFMPGKEMLVYGDGLEMLEQIAWAKAHPGAAERMGRAAWERVQAEHLPRHRVKTLVELAQTATRHRAEGEEAQRLFWLSAAQLVRNGLPLCPISFLLNKMELLTPHPDLIAEQLRLLAETKNSRKALVLCRDVLIRNLFATSLTLNATASGCAMRLGDFAVARQFWYRHALHSQRPDLNNTANPVSPFALCLLWAEVLRHAGRAAQPGFAFNSEHGHVPEAAYEFLLLAQHMDGANKEVDEKADALCAQVPAYAFFRLGHLAQRCLYARDNWRLQLEYGFVALRACRVAEGLLEIREARDKARAQSKTAAFERVLAAHPSRAYIDRALLHASC